MFGVAFGDVLTGTVMFPQDVCLNELRTVSGMSG